MNANFQKIKRLVLEADIPSADKEELLLAFSKVNDADLEPALKLFLEDESWIKKISDNFQAKSAIAMSGDSKFWQDMLRKEETQLAEMEK